MAESEFAGTVKELQGLVALNETLKTHMEQFEASCKRQAEELRAKAQRIVVCLFVLSLLMICSRCLRCAARMKKTERRSKELK